MLVSNHGEVAASPWYGLEVMGNLIVICLNECQLNEPPGVNRWT